jgi:hypothetical protein
MNNPNLLGLLTAPTRVGSGVLLGTRPKSLINGKRNPEYSKWWRVNNPEKWKLMHDRAQKKWVKNNPEKHRECQRRYEPKYRAALREQGIVHTKDECKCVSCGMVFTKDAALLRGFKCLSGARGFNVICDECA